MTNEGLILIQDIIIYDESLEPGTRGYRYEAMIGALYESYETNNEPER